MNKTDEQMIGELYDAYIYGFPLVVLDLHTKGLTNTIEPTSSKAPLNQFLHADNVATANDHEVVHPNIDTVYSKAHINLKGCPLYLHKPAAQRYAAAEILDAYGNCIANIGSGEIGGNGEVHAVLTGPGYKGNIPSGLVHIEVPTNNCWILARILKDKDDEEIVRSIQKGFFLRPLDAYMDENYVPPKGTFRKEYDFIPFEQLSRISTEEFFGIFNSMIGDNMGKNPDLELLEKVKPYGVGDSLNFSYSRFNDNVVRELQGFYQRAIKDFRRPNAAGADSGSKNWNFTHPDKSTMANFKWDYLKRAQVSWSGFGALPASVAIYPTASHDDEGRVLSGEHRYICHFASQPPVNEFWSLTAYGEDLFLIPNEINRNGINDRSPLKVNEDGSFDIYLQKDMPSKDFISNWLPVDEGIFGLVLRLYYAKDEFLNGQWETPRIYRNE